MKANMYQKWTKTTVVYKGDSPLQYFTLGLVGEAGEVADKVKKIMRDGIPIGELSAKRIELQHELGDIMWYLARLAAYFGITLEDLMDLNRKKLMDRKKRNKLHGQGDNR